MNQKKKRKYKKKKQISPKITVVSLVAFCLLAAACFLAIASGGGKHLFSIMSHEVGEKVQQTISQHDSQDDATDTAAQLPLPEIKGTDRGRGYTVCLDAGHGGYDPGATTDERTEAVDTLAMTLRIQQYLEAEGCKVVMTRTDDSYPTLEDRVYIANEADADVLVSIHRNTAESKDAKGVEVWINSAKPENAVTLSTCLLDQIGANTSFDVSRGTQAGTSGNASQNYAINRGSKMASCILELGFISNKEDNRIYDEEMDEIAKAVSDAILDAIEQNSATSGQ